jgi:pyroglutamyl-peptidase
MLGEAAGSREIRFETTAWNEKTFEIPDIKGRRPNGVPIRNGAATFLKSTLPLKEIHQELETNGRIFSVSDDPGRYLCNQLFFTALDFLEANSMNIPAGFIHLPLADDRAIPDTSHTIAETIKLIQSL